MPVRTFWRTCKRLYLFEQVEDMIIDHEEVFFEGADKPYFTIAMYYVKEGRIRKMSFY